MDSIRDIIRKAVNQAFKDNNLDREQFNHDGTFFNCTSIRASVIFDKCSIPKQFVVVGLGVHLDGDWEVVQFQHMTDNFDGIDAMNEADAFLLAGK
jgi:hypothetical protein